MTEFKIEKDVPLPSVRSRYIVYPFDEMDVGDSLVLPPKGAIAARAWARTRGRRVAARVQEDGQMRVWRIE